MQINGVVFDFDYTLYDRDASDAIAIGHYFDVNSDEFCEGVTKELVRASFREAEHRHNYESWRRMLQFMMDEGVLRVMPDPAKVARFVQRELALHGVAYPFLDDTLQKLREMGLAIGMITNGSREFQWGKIRGKLDMEHKFDQILVGWDPNTAKPHPDLFLKMADLLGSSPEALLYVGDNPINDVDASRNAGYIPVWVRTITPWRYPDVQQPELQVDSVAELPEIIRALRAK